MRKTILSVLIGLALSCGTLTPCFAQWTRTIVGHAAYLDPQDVPFAYQRPSDPIVGPMYFVVGDDATFCEVTPQEFVMLQNGENFLCRWRYAR